MSVVISGRVSQTTANVMVNQLNLAMKLENQLINNK